MWNRGDQIVLREHWHGRLWSVRPVTVVHDQPDLIALYLGPGASWLRACGLDGKRLPLPIGDWALRDIGWRVSCLRLHVPGARHDILMFTEPEHDRLHHWYVNIQTPLERTTLGFDYTDHVLDATMSADRTQWQWDDEDELEEAVTRGLIPGEQVRRLYAEGERAIALLQARHPPYDDRWDGWRPDPSWPIARLPDGWDARRT